MRWLKNIWNNKKARYSTLIVAAVVVVIAAFGGSTMLLRQQYQQSVANWRTSLQASFEASGKKIEAAKSPPEVIATLDETQKLLDDWPAPAPSTILGIPVIPNQTRQTLETAKTQAARISDTVTIIKAFYVYQTAVTKPLASMSDKSTENIEQLKKLEGEWRSATKTITNVAPPEKAKTFHQSLAKMLDGAVADLAALVPLFEKKDVAGFEAKKEEFSNKISALQNLGDQFASLAKTQDEELAKQLHELDHKLREVAN